MSIRDYRITSPSTLDDLRSIIKKASKDGNVFEVTAEELSSKTPPDGSSTKAIPFKLEICESLHSQSDPLEDYVEVKNTMTNITGFIYSSPEPLLIFVS